MSKISIRDAGYLLLLDRASRSPATVVDFPEPVDPTIAECLVINLLISIKAGIDSAPAICPIFTRFVLSMLP